jgi:phosphonate transport system ATP-binding protein
VIGKSGAGKSTLMRLLNRLIDPTAGQILHEGKDVTKLHGRALLDWRSRCAMVFQQFHLVDRLDVLTNVMLGRMRKKSLVASLMKWFSEEDRVLALEALDRVDLLPQALQRTETLSGGQQQRVAIARAMLQDPVIILADEPISSLDPKSAERIMGSLKKINEERGITVLCNLHSIETARHYCERLVGMQRGRVVFDGPPDRLTAKQIEMVYEGETEELADMAASEPMNQEPGAESGIPSAAAASLRASESAG